MRITLDKKGNIIRENDFPMPAIKTAEKSKLDTYHIAEAYNEAAEHLDMVAAETNANTATEQWEGEKAAYLCVAGNLRRLAGAYLAKQK